jgi:hypothetical protein
MDGLVIKKLWRYAATVSSQETRLCSLASSISAAHHSGCQHKKGAGFALTRLATLRHNNLVRECVHDEKFSRSR